ncbi:MAG: fluoride efflux transporter CrcB [Planctomycetaceae bacterium]|nr:fluoride efflux transporter CrcB [Planctomycetaceae bacterium]
MEDRTALMIERLEIWMAVACGGAGGAVARYALSHWVVRKFPMGTFVVNVAGCLLIGLIVGSLQQREWLSPVLRHLLIAGFLGSLTTFSTFGYQCVQMLIDGNLQLALLNVLANTSVGFAAVGIGLWLGAGWTPAGH